MVKIRVIIRRHDGISKRAALWKCVDRAEAYIYKLVESCHNFNLITDDSQMDLLLADKSKEFFLKEGLEIVTPREYVAKRTVFVRGIYINLVENSDMEIASYITLNPPLYSTEKIIGLPSPRNLKIVC